MKNRVRLVMLIASLAPPASWCGGPAWGEEPRCGPSPLAALVPCDAGLCLELRGLAARLEQFDAAPLSGRLQRFPPLAKHQEENRRQWERIASELKLHLGSSGDEFVAQLLGHEALFAAWPPEAGAAQGRGMFLTKGAGAGFLNTVVDRLVALLRTTGQWKAAHAMSYGKGSCQVHEIASPEGGLPVFLTAVDGLGIVANDRNLVRDALALEAGETLPRGSLEELPAYRAAVARAGADACVRLVVNPRPWDAALEADLQTKAPDSHSYRTQQLAVEAWRATDYAVVSLELAREMRLEGLVAWNHDLLPAEWREAADSLSGRAALLDHVPNDAVAAVVGHLDLGRLLRQAALADAAANGRSGLSPGWLAALSIAPGLGPDAAAYLVRRASRDDEERPPAHVLPFDWIVGISTRPLEAGDGRPSLANLVEPMLHSALSVAAAARADGAAGTTELRTQDVDGVTTTSLAGSGPSQRPFEAAYAIVDNCFWGGASSPAVRRAARLQPEESLAGSPALQRRNNFRLDAPSQLVYLDLAALRQIVNDSPDAVVWLARAKGLDEKAAERSRTELLGLLELADALFAAAEVRSTGFAISLILSADDDPSVDERETTAPRASQTPAGGVVQ